MQGECGVVRTAARLHVASDRAHVVQHLGDGRCVQGCRRIDGEDRGRVGEAFVACGIDGPHSDAVCTTGQGGGGREAPVATRDGGRADQGGNTTNRVVHVDLGHIGAGARARDRGGVVIGGVVGGVGDRSDHCAHVVGDRNRAQACSGRASGVYRDDHGRAGQTGVARWVGGCGGDAVWAFAQGVGRCDAPGSVGAHGRGADHCAGVASVGQRDGVARCAGAGEGRCPVVGRATTTDGAGYAALVVCERRSARHIRHGRVHRDNDRRAGQTGVARWVGGCGGDAVWAFAQGVGRCDAPGSVGAHGRGADHCAGVASVGQRDGVARCAGAGEGRCPVVGRATTTDGAGYAALVVCERGCGWRCGCCSVYGEGQRRATGTLHTSGIEDGVGQAARTAAQRRIGRECASDRVVSCSDGSTVHIKYRTGRARRQCANADARRVIVGARRCAGPTLDGAGVVHIGSGCRRRGIDHVIH